MSWIDELRARYRSNAKAAVALRREWMRVKPLDAKEVSEQSLATKIGELRRGQVDWWRRRGRLTQVLADMLAVDPEALLGDPRKHVGALPFPEFQALPPLQADEEPPPLFGDGWLLRALLPTEREAHRWVVAPAGFGKSLALRYYELRHAEETLAVRAPTLDAAVTNVGNDGRLVVIEIERRDPRDRDAMDALRRCVLRAVVLAPYSPNDAMDEVSVSALDRKRAPNGWAVVRPELEDRWREQLLRWVEGRLASAPGDTKLSADELLAWLDEHDPDQALVPSPGDLLALAAIFHGYPARSWSLADVARRWTRTLAVSPGTQDDAARLWTRHCASRTFRKLARRQLRRMQSPMGQLPPSVWENLVPRATLPAPVREGPGARLAVGYLRERGVLRGHRGELALFPRFAAAGEAIAHITWLLRSGRVHAWGSMAVDEERRHLVDRALRTLPASDLLEVIRSVVELADKEASAALTGALEAGFHSAAQRFTDESFSLPPEDVPTWQRLAVLQCHHLVVDAGWDGLHRPLTRDGEDAQAAWMADAWLFSLRVPAPEPGLRETLDWDFPGWVKELRLANLPNVRLFPSSTLPSNGAEYAPTACIEIIALLGPTLAQRCVDASPPKELPRLLVPAVILGAASHDWSLDPEHVSALRYSWEERRLVDILRKMDARERYPCFARLWAAALSCAPVGSTLEAALLHLFSTHRVLVPFLLQAVPLETLRSTLEERGWTKYDDRPYADLLPLMPQVHRQEAYRRWVVEPSSDHMSKWFRAREMLARVPAEDFDALFEVYSPADADTLSEFARVLWQRDPQRALREARRALDTASPVAVGWLWECPREHLQAVAEQAARLEPVPEWLSRWAQRRLTQAGAAADVLYGILRRGSGSAESER